MSKTQRMINKMNFNVKQTKKSVWRGDCVGILSVFNHFAINCHNKLKQNIVLVGFFTQ